MSKLYNEPNTSENGHLAQKLRAIQDMRFWKTGENEHSHPSYTTKGKTIGVMVGGETSNALVHRIAPPRGLNGYLGCVGAYILDSS